MWHTLSFKCFLSFWLPFTRSSISTPPEHEMHVALQGMPQGWMGSGFGHEGSKASTSSLLLALLLHYGSHVFSAQGAKRARSGSTRSPANAKVCHWLAHLLGCGMLGKGALSTTDTCVHIVQSSHHTPSPMKMARAMTVRKTVRENLVQMAT